METPIPSKNEWMRSIHVITTRPFRVPINYIKDASARTLFVAIEKLRFYSDQAVTAHCSVLRGCCEYLHHNADPVDFVLLLIVTAPKCTSGRSVD